MAETVRLYHPELNRLQDVRPAAVPALTRAGWLPADEVAGDEASENESPPEDEVRQESADPSAESDQDHNGPQTAEEL